MDFEKLGAFYLGKEYSLAERRLLDRLGCMTPRPTTHAICIGMTGNGRTGICISSKRLPSMGSRQSSSIPGETSPTASPVPDLAPADFLPWINPDDTLRKGLTPEDCAAKQAESWKSGLAS
jgi:hypothetical protein